MYLDILCFTQSICKLHGVMDDKPILDNPKIADIEHVLLSYVVIR